MMPNEKPKKEKKPKKPMNAFFVYRKLIRAKIVEKYGVRKSHEVSKIAGECWANEPLHVKDHFRNLSYGLQEQTNYERRRKAMASNSLTSLEELNPEEDVTLSDLQSPTLNSSMTYNFKITPPPVQTSLIFLPPIIGTPTDYSLHALSTGDSTSYNSQPSPSLSFTSLPNDENYIHSPVRHCRSNSDFPGFNNENSRTYAQAVYEQEQRQLQFLFDAPNPSFACHQD